MEATSAKNGVRGGLGGHVEGHRLRRHKKAVHIASYRSMWRPGASQWGAMDVQIEAEVRPTLSGETDFFWGLRMRVSKLVLGTLWA